MTKVPQKPTQQAGERPISSRLERPSIKVLPALPLGEIQQAPHTPKMRAILTAEERKQVFIRNLNQLLDVLGVNRKAAAEAIQIPYRWVRRVVTSGISRPDERNQEALERLVSYFALPGIEALWTPNLVAALIASEQGRPFVEKFGPGISTMVHGQVEQSGRIDETLVDAWISTHGAPEQRSTPGYEAKLAALVATGRYDSLAQLDALCRRMVDEAYQIECSRETREATTA